jgi:hypothetical protein
MSNTIPLPPADHAYNSGSFAPLWGEAKMHAHAAAVSAERDARIKLLEDVLRGVLPWVVTQEVACHGLKCREAVCMSCDSDSAANVELACDAYGAARAALGDKTPNARVQAAVGRLERSVRHARTNLGEQR